MRENRMTPIGQNTFRVTVDPRPDGSISGEVRSGALGKSATFASLSRLIVLIEEWMDAAGDAAPPAKPTGGAQPADYEIEIIFRQNFTWQGKLRCIKDETEAVFRSVLELLIQLETGLAR